MNAILAHVAAVLVCGAPGPERSAPIVAEPACTDPTPHLSLPVSFEDRALLYWSFDRPGAGPEIDRIGVKRPRRFESRPDGIRGACAACVKQREFRLQSPRLSPHRALSVSVWWALERDLKIDDTFGIMSIHGRTRRYISHFSRGQGRWCALKEPCGVFQVYNFAGIRDVHALYDRRLTRHLDLRRGRWHHSAITIAAGRRLVVYTDGQPVCEVFLQGRALSADDGLDMLTVGSCRGVLSRIDELIVVDRVLSPYEVRDYYDAITQMHEVDYPLR